MQSINSHNDIHWEPKFDVNSLDKYDKPEICSKKYKFSQFHKSDTKLNSEEDEEIKINPFVYNTFVPTLSKPVHIKNMKEVKQISCGYEHTIFLTRYYEI